jgi:crotonobetainyl-CoA:carnitine CoA-transferase CaiB-like acyl-CoA transferase
LRSDDGLRDRRAAGLSVGHGGALRDLQVLDLSRVLAGPLCAQMLADHGAEVTKVEAPSGDETRRWGPPFVEGAEDMSSYYYGINRSKSNIALNLQVREARETLLRLILSADIVIENFKSGTMREWGLDYDEVLRVANPSLIYCQITGYGSSGPLGGAAGYDAALQAFGGLMSVNGEKAGGPLRVGVPIVDITAAHLAFEGILLALHERQRGGDGQLIDISLLDAVTSILHPHASAWAETGVSPARSGGEHPSVVPYQILAAADGELVFIAAASDKQFAKLVGVLGQPELADDVRFEHNRDRIENRGELTAVLARLIRTWNAADLSAQLLKAGLASSPVNSVGAALKSEAVRERAMFVENDSYRGTGIPVKLSVSGASGVSVPGEIGRDSTTVLMRLGLSPDEIEHLRTTGALG